VIKSCPFVTPRQHGWANKKHIKIQQRHNLLQEK
jgi:hypothetical protein